MAEIGGAATIPPDLSAYAKTSDVEAMAAKIPTASSSAPPAVATDSAAGSASPYARADHTHESRLQARRAQFAFNASGEAVWTFPRAYDAAVLPIVNATAETPAGATYKYDVSIKQGSISNTNCTLILNKIPKTLTVSLLGAVLNVFTSPADTVWVHVMSRAPST